MKSGKVYFVEPVYADIESLDPRTRHILSSVDVVLHDSSSPAEILAVVRPSARQHNVGEFGTPSGMSPEEIRAQLVTYATQGFDVVRIDEPGVAGARTRKHEANVLRLCGIEFEVLSAEAVDRAEARTVAVGV